MMDQIADAPTTFHQACEQLILDLLNKPNFIEAVNSIPERIARVTQYFLFFLQIILLSNLLISMKRGRSKRLWKKESLVLEKLGQNLSMRI